MPGEFDYLDWLRQQTPPADRVLIGPGDDCALLAPSGRATLITTDMLMDGTDFILADVGGIRVGRKAMAVNLSDIAAMAGRPIAAVVSVALPLYPLVGTTRELAEDLYKGLREMADRFGVPIVGGDTNSWAGPLVISITVLGEPTGTGAVRRSGAKPGDAIFVTGPLGGSLLGHHLDFTPRIVEAQRLHAAVELHAMADISDGLTADLAHILRESHCGAVLTERFIPVSAAAVSRSVQTEQPPLSHALSDGEDFELVFTVSPESAMKLRTDPPIPGLVEIGECLPEGYWLFDGRTRHPLTPRGWVHQV